MARVERIKSLQDKMRKIAGQYAEVSVKMGYTAAGALHLHENLEMKWKGIPRDPRERATKSGKHINPPRSRQFNPKGYFWDPQGRAQAKFLEAPARYLKSILADIVCKAMKSKKTMKQALILAALRLGRESQQLVPVDTGNLKASAFYQVEGGEKVLLDNS